MANNFIHKKTGETFYYSTFSTSIKDDGSVVYKDKYKKEIIHPENGERLELIPKEGIPAFFASENERLKRTQAHFKERAKKHTQSEEARGIKQKVKDREMDNMGYEKVKKSEAKKQK